MSETLDRIRGLVRKGKVVISRHGFREIAADDILFSELLSSIEAAVVVEDYPEATKGPTVLALQWESASRPVHVVWGIEKGTDDPAVLVTAYRPSVAKWSADFMSRKKT